MTEYWYAWRGGPNILRATASNAAALNRELSRLMPGAIEAYRGLRRHAVDQTTLYGLITRYLTSPQAMRASPRTRYDRRICLDRVRTELGEMELRAFEARAARAVLIGWRDRFASTPKTADALLGALSTVLQWAADRGEIAMNPLVKFPRLYRCNRAEMIWEPHHLAALLRCCSIELSYAVRLAALSGLRLGDLIQLPWSAVGEHAIVWRTGKSRGRLTIVIPIYDELRELLDEIPRRDSPTVLNSGRGGPWSVQGIESGLRRAKEDAKINLSHLRFHDLRGTAATSFIRAGLDLNDVATVLGWTKGKVEQIAARYVTAEEIGLAMVDKLTRAREQSAQSRLAESAESGRPSTAQMPTSSVIDEVPKARSG